jgi:hypothetical protein
MISDMNACGNVFENSMEGEHPKITVSKWLKKLSRLGDIMLFGKSQPKLYPMLYVSGYQ